MAASSHNYYHKMKDHDYIELQGSVNWRPPPPKYTSLPRSKATYHQPQYTQAIGRRDSRTRLLTDSTISEEIEEPAKNITDAFISFADTTSLMGIPFIKRANRWHAKVFWVLVFLAATGAWIFHSYFLIFTYLQHETSSSVAISYQHVPFPSVTFCNINPVKSNRMSTYGSRELQAFMLSLKPKEALQYNQNQPGKNNNQPGNNNAGTQGSNAPGGNTNGNNNNAPGSNSGNSNQGSNTIATSTQTQTTSGNKPPATATTPIVPPSTVSQSNTQKNNPNPTTQVTNNQATTSKQNNNNNNSPPLTPTASNNPVGPTGTTHANAPPATTTKPNNNNPSPVTTTTQSITTTNKGNNSPPLVPTTTQQTSTHTTDKNTPPVTTTTQPTTTTQKATNNPPLTIITTQPTITTQQTTNNPSLVTSTTQSMTTTHTANKNPTLITTTTQPTNTQTSSNNPPTVTTTTQPTTTTQKATNNPPTTIITTQPTIATQQTTNNPSLVTTTTQSMTTTHTANKNPTLITTTTHPTITQTSSNNPPTVTTTTQPTTTTQKTNNNPSTIITTTHLTTLTQQTNTNNPKPGTTTHGNNQPTTTQTQPPNQQGGGSNSTPPPPGGPKPGRRKLLAVNSGKETGSQKRNSQTSVYQYSNYEAQSPMYISSGGINWTAMAESAYDYKDIILDSGVSSTVRAKAVFKEVMANLPNSNRSNMGHSLSEMMLSCSYNGEECTARNFTRSLNIDYGNCWTFNSEELQDEPATSIRGGATTGLDLVLNIQEDEYLQGLNIGRGIRLHLHPFNTMSFVATSGISISPGQQTYVGVRVINQTRLGGIYGSCNDDSGTFSSYYQGAYEYTLDGCINTCLERTISAECGCFRKTQQQLYTRSDIQNLTYCSSLDEQLCVRKYTEEYNNGYLTCGCKQGCNTVDYENSVTSDEWPPATLWYSLIDAVCVRDSTECTHFEKVTPPDFDKTLKKNFIHLKVYYRDLNVQKINEQAQYEIPQFASDFGGTLGLWLGATAVTVVEIFDLTCNICKLCVKKSKITKKNTESMAQKRRPSPQHLILERSREKPTVARVVYERAV